VQPGHVRSLTPQLAPNLVGAEDLQVRLPDSLDVDAQHVIALDTGIAQCRVALRRSVAPIARRRDLHHLADRLDTVGMAVPVDESLHGLKWRPSSAWAKKALARRRISFPLRSSRTSRSSALTRSSLVEVRPGLDKRSVAIFLTESGRDRARTVVQARNHRAGGVDRPARATTARAPRRDCGNIA